MASKQIINGIKLIIALGGFASKPDLLSALKSSVSVHKTLEAMLRKDLPSVDSLAELLAEQAKETMLGLEHDLPLEAPVLYEQMVIASLPNATDIVRSDMDAHLITTKMMDAHVDPEHLTPGMQSLFRAITEPVLSSLLADKSFTDDLMPAHMARVLRRLKDQADLVSSVSAKVDALAERIIDVLNKQPNSDAQERTSTQDRPSVSVGNFDTFENVGAQNSELSTAIEREFVKFLTGKGLRVSSRHTVHRTLAARFEINGKLVQQDNKAEFFLELAQDGVLIRAVSVTGSLAHFQNMSETLPESLLSFSGLSTETLLPISQIHPTDSILAFWMFAEAQRLAALQRTESAILMLEEALKEDPSFFTALWAKGDLKEKSMAGGGKEIMCEALRQDRDLQQKSIFLDQPNPLPALVRNYAPKSWKKLASGLEMAATTSDEYGISVCAWRVCLNTLAVHVVSADGVFGESISEIREREKALFAINGAPWDRDAFDRLSPSGYLVSRGQTIHSKRDSAGSGVFLIDQDGPKIQYREDEIGGEVLEGLQSGPIVVEPDGTEGIKVENNIRAARSVVGIVDEHTLLFVLVRGGLSLRELSTILSPGGIDLGLSCTTALNLDGGPSTQVSFIEAGVPKTIEGVWPVQSAIIACEK